MPADSITLGAAALPEPGEAVLVSAGDTTAASLDTAVAPAAGDYHLTFVCVGTGQVRVKLFDAAEPVEDVRDLSCTDSGAMAELAVSITAAADLMVSVDGWPGTEAGYAYRLWQS